MKQADPYQLRVTAAAFTHHSGELRDRAKRIDRLRSELLDGKNGWRGQGASAFSARCEIMKYELEQSTVVLDQAAKALEQLAGMMEQVNDLRSQANHLEAMAQECTAEEEERRFSLLNQANYSRQEADQLADIGDRQAASAFAAAMESVPNILGIRDPEQDMGELLNSLPEPYRSYYARHKELLAEETELDPEGSHKKKRHVFLVGGISPSENVNELAINNLGEMLVDNGEADSYQVVDEFTPDDVMTGIKEVTLEKLYVDRHRSDDLAKMIEEYHKEHPDEEIDIIAHSGGGEISKNAENELYYKGEGDYVNKMISFGGADWTDPNNKKIYHITSPYDVVGVPGNLSQERVGGMNNPLTELLGERRGTEEIVKLNGDNYNIAKHINAGVGDHVNYFEPGTDLNKSYQNVVHELDSNDPISKVPHSSLLDQNSELYSETEKLYYTGELEVAEKEVGKLESTAGNAINKMENNIKSLGHNLLDNID